MSVPAAGRDHAAADLWQRTLSAIPTLYGRLTWLTGLRDPNTGRYVHHGLALVFGEDAAHNALRRSHVQCFQEWMMLSSDEQIADLDRYVASLDAPRATVAQAWTQVPAWRNLVPVSVRGPERKLFLAEAAALMDRLRRLESADGSAPDASRAP